ncbi:Protein of unknown function DUF166 [Desulfatibacillum aliphaticivorans]|uniref:Thymidylate synthase n=1 Tax=Desulfatibacillum aliphaticivorans TaxID=218208 RepID=B8FDB6_DESAL|nr:DUF166 family (seleno)protein DfsP [Desulfatibacillum aliphaticivorans]ACL06547.1 Protein of unknown function DUF166 [Desulfatibacillum aliphaticivorans]
MQVIKVFQQNNSGARKIAAVRERAGDDLVLDVINIDDALPMVLDDTEEYLKEAWEMEADLVLDYLKHPDLSYDLCRICSERGIPVVSPTKKWRRPHVFTPPTCCGLPRNDELGAYACSFGAPEVEAAVEDGVVKEIRVIRGAPCGATWEAAQDVLGKPVEEAGVAIGLKVQFYCVADPAGWDPIYGKSPVHFAGHVHQAALEKALRKS